METIEYQEVISSRDIERFPISITTTEVNLTGSWRFFKPVFREKISPCRLACPNNINIPKYIFYILKNDLESACKILREDNPFPATCGRVCPHFCQESCNRGEYDANIEIRELEKFLGDYALNIPYKKPEVKIDKKVAIIGGGPAGISCAYYLAKNGINVTIFERESFLGGLLIYGIPEYRLPKDIVKKEIENILSIGNIEVNTNENFDYGKIIEISEKYDAVFVAVGVSKSKELKDIPFDNEKIISGYNFLKRLNLDNNFKIENEKIAIIGGGNVAIDVAMNLLRMNNEPVIIYRREIANMPAFEEEIKEALEEGIKILTKKIIGKYELGDKVKVWLEEVKEIKGDKIISEQIENNFYEFDRIIFAIGQVREFQNRFDKKNIFTGGDFDYGAKTVAEAISSGKINAYKIINFLTGKNLYKELDSKDVISFDKINTFYFKKEKPLVVEKNTKPPLDKILNEAKRCFSCGVCNLCKTCWFSCPDLSVEVTDKVYFDYDHCKGCGLCANECPRGVIEMVEEL